MQTSRGKLKKDCAFQYAVANKGWLDKSPIIEDTDLITYEEAVKLWNKYLPDFIKRYEDEQSPEMAIWTDMKNNTDYHTDKHHLDARDNLKIVNGRIFQITETEMGKL